MIGRYWRIVLTSLAVACSLTSCFAASQKVLYNFTATKGDGAEPYAGLIFDASGNLYGTTEYGGPYGDGIVFELTPQANGEWSETILHTFSWTDGAHPVANLIFDGAGNLYGTTVYGGADGKGTVFELSPTIGGWTETVLHDFSARDGDEHPHAPLIFDSSGNLYGTTIGRPGFGTVFELSPAIDGSWTETILCDFAADVNGRENGWNPYGGLVIDAAGNLYGTTSSGGGHRSGAVFELTPSQDGTWTETLLAHCARTQCYDPNAGLIFDRNGNLYGTAAGGGTHNYGTIFQLSPVAGGGWTPKNLYDFSGTNGAAPLASLITDARGNLYGTTRGGGVNNAGTVFELTQNSNGEWVEGYFSLTGDPSGGPVGSLVFDADGNLYGTTPAGGTYGAGTVFEITR